MLLHLLVLLSLLALLGVFMLLPGESTIEQREPFWGLCCAHRGLHTPDTSVPENSIAAFTAAVDAGYGIELDIRLSADGEVVVFHDDDLKRVCGKDARVDSLTLVQLQELPLFGSDQRIPTLREVLEVVDERVPLIIELKHSLAPGRNKALCEAAWRILRRYDGDICIESFDPRIVRWFSRHVPGLLRGQLAARPEALNQGIFGFLVGNLLTNFLGRPHFIAYQKGPRPPLARWASRLAMQVVWTVRPEDDVDALCDENDAVIFEFLLPEPRYDAGHLTVTTPEADKKRKKRWWQRAKPAEAPDATDQPPDDTGDADDAFDDSLPED